MNLLKKYHILTVKKQWPPEVYVRIVRTYFSDKTNQFLELQGLGSSLLNLNAIASMIELKDYGVCTNKH